jgi:hypothetical protein
MRCGIVRRFRRNGCNGDYRRNIQRIAVSKGVVVYPFQEFILRFVRSAVLGILAVFMFCATSLASMNVYVGPSPAAAAALPKVAGDYREFGASESVESNTAVTETFGVAEGVTKHYRSSRGDLLTVSLLQMKSSSHAYSYLTAQSLFSERPYEVRQYDVGTASIEGPKGVSFVRGNYFVTIEMDRPSVNDITPALVLGRKLADSLGNDRDEIPVLVKHLPNWEKASSRAVYLLDIDTLTLALEPFQPLLAVLNFNAGEEAVLANYEPAQLLMVENTTPQLATDADARIQQKLTELRAAGQSPNTYYRRIGNYSAFVFNAPDQATADGLLNQITYEKTVSWLGDNPYPLQQAQRNYTQTMGGVILAVVQGAGLAILICGLVGGVFGALVFRQRRRRQAQSTAFSDAGGMLRLNLDEMTPQLDHSRLLDKGSNG